MRAGSQALPGRPPCREPDALAPRPGRLPARRRPRHAGPGGLGRPGAPPAPGARPPPVAHASRRRASSPCAPACRARDSRTAAPPQAGPQAIGRATPWLRLADPKVSRVVCRVSGSGEHGVLINPTTKPVYVRKTGSEQVQALQGLHEACVCS